MRMATPFQRSVERIIPGDSITRDQMNAVYDSWKAVEHPNIERFMQRPLTHWDFKWHIPMEYIYGEKLENVMFHPRNSSIQLTPVNTGRIITGMCEGLLHLHNYGTAHKDIRPENIMVESETCRAVITEVFFSLKPPQTTGNLYAAPEIINNPGAEPDHLADVWSMGKIIAELLLGYRMEHKDMSPNSLQDDLHGNIYCNPVSKMSRESPGWRATMADVIDEIRAAETNVQQQYTLSVPRARRSADLPCALQPFPHSSYSDNSFSIQHQNAGLPPIFPITYPLPPNHTMKFKHVQYDSRGQEKNTQAEVRTKHGRIQEAWWMTCQPNAYDEDDEDNLPLPYRSNNL